MVHGQNLLERSRLHGSCWKTGQLSGQARPDCTGGQWDTGTDGQEYSRTGMEDRGQRRAADMLSTRQKAEVRNFTVCWQPATTSASSFTPSSCLASSWCRDAVRDAFRDAT